MRARNAATGSVAPDSASSTAQQVRVAALQRGQHQRVAVGEVDVDGRRGDAHLASDGRDRASSSASSSSSRSVGVDDLGAQPLALAPRVAAA